MFSAWFMKLNLFAKQNCDFINLSKYCMLNYVLYYHWKTRVTLSGIKCWGHYFRYHNREAVVVSALQVEKHPISTPGPYATPPLQGRHFHAPGIGGFSALQMTPPLGIRDSPRAGSPIPRPGSGASGSYIGSPRIGDIYRRPHSSPKMKLRFTFNPWTSNLL